MKSTGKATVDYKLNSIEWAAGHVRAALRRDGRLTPADRIDLRNIRRKVRQRLGLTRSERRGERRGSR